MSLKKNRIEIEVSLGEDKIPEKIEWNTSVEGIDKGADCKAMMLSFFERPTMDTLRMDLWTKDMQVGEMDRFFFQTLRAMADTYFKATQNQQLASDMQKFVHYFGEETGIIPRNEKG